MRVLITVGTHNMDTLSVDVEHHSLVRAELFTIFANWFPDVWISCFCSSDGLWVAAFRLVLMIGFYLLLVNPNDVKVHLANLSPSVFEPKHLQELIDVK